MFTLLSWLNDQAWKVYLFFGWLFDRIRDAALNAWEWARNAASDAFWWAWDWILYYYNEAKNRIGEALQSAWNSAVQLFEIARSLLNDVYVWAVGEFLYWWGRAVDSAQLLVDGAVAIFNWAISQATANLRGLMDLSRIILDAARERLRISIEGRISQFETEFETFRASFSADTREGIDNIVTIFQNPVGWIFALLLERFIEFASYQVATGLGTVKYDLPPAPIFGGSGGGGGGGGTLPPGAGIIGAPLSSLHISGHTFGNPSGHLGVDFGLQNGDPVYASHDGEITAAGWSSVGYGFQVVIQGDEYWSRYAHCEAVTVTIGQNVRTGQQIGMGNSTGNSTGPHLHLEIRRFGAPIDPLSVL